MPQPDSAYRRRTFDLMAVYVLLNVAAILGLFDRLGDAGRWGLSLAVAAPIAGQIWATLSYMRDSDEFLRALTARRFILASGLSMALFSAWGFAESYARAPHAPGWLIYALFWGVYGLISPLVRSTR